MCEFVDRAFSSIVLVVPSKDAEGVAAKNHLSFCEMMGPFGNFTINQPQYPNPFSVRFLYLKDIVRATAKEAQDSTLTAVAKFKVSYPTEEEQAGGTLKAEPTPWFDAYCREFLRLVRSSDHEFFNHPISCLSVVSTSNPDPISFLEQSYSSENPPRPFTAQGLESNIHRYYLLVHDASSGDENKADAILAKMKEKFGNLSCAKLVINTYVGEKDENDGMKELWSNFLSNSPKAEVAKERTGEKEQEPAGEESSDPLQSQSGESSGSSSTAVIGEKLSPADLKRIQMFVNGFGMNSFVPYLESVAERLEAYIAHSKKSAYSSAKKWFGLGSSSSSKPNVDLSDQSLSSLSSRMAQRRLGDIAFVLQKYETAINTYHAVKKEFSHDKAWKDFAGAQEMEGVCVYMQENNRPDHRYFDYAIHNYDKCKASLYLCRSTLIAGHISLSCGKFKEAAMAFMRSANEESDLRSALLLEQVAMCHLRMTQPCRKRAAFHMVLAGHRFVKAGLRENALRCYVQARQVYCNKQWNLAEDHVNFTVGKQAYNVGKASDALAAFWGLLSDSNQQVAQQKLYMKEFIHAWKNVHGSDTDIIEELPVPIIEDESISLSTNATDRKISDPTWNSLEFALLGLAKHKRVRVSSMSRFTRQSNLDQSPVCVSGETFFLDMTLRNPLRISIELRDVKLLATVKTENDEEIHIQDTSELFVKIPARSSKSIKLSATSVRTGQVRLQGIQYSFGGAVHGSRRFKAQGKRLSKTRYHLLNAVYAPDYRLTPIVIPPMPLLEGSITGLAQTLISGQVVDGALKLVNNSNATLCQLHIACSRSDCVAFHTEEINGSINSVTDMDVTTLTLDLPDGLPAGSECTIPFSFQASTDLAQTIDVMFMVYYEAQNPHPRLPYRMLKLVASMMISPSLSVSSSIHKAPGTLDERLVRIVATNSHPKDATLSVRSMLSNSSSWDMECVSKESEDSKSKFTLKRGESVCFVCKIIAAQSREAGDSKFQVLSLSEAMSETDCMNTISKRYLTNVASSKLGFALFWDLSGGENHVISGHTGAKVPIIEQNFGDSSSLSKGIEIGMKHPADFVHDFTASPLAVISLDLVFQNCTESQINAMVELLDPVNSNASKPGPLIKKQGHFSWCGKTKLRIGPIGAEVLRFPLSVAVTGPGVYDVNSLNVVALSEAGATTATLGYPCLICVRQGERNESSA